MRWDTIPQAAETFQVTEKTIRNWIATGVIDARRIGPKLIRVDIDSVVTDSLPSGVVA